MADIQHSSITDPHIHEPKGASTAASGTVYVASGSGSGSWQVLGTDSINLPAVLGEIQDDLDSGDLEVTGKYWVHARLDDISTASSVLIPVIQDSTVLQASVVLAGAITTTDATVSFKNAGGGSLGTSVTVPFSGSGKGNQFAFTATANNVLTGPTWIEVETDGASDTAQSLYILIELETQLN